MPQKLYDADGNEFEVATAEELKELQERAEKAEEIEERSKELEELANMHPKDLRAAYENNKKTLKTLESMGKELNDKGEIVDKTIKPMSAEEIDTRTRETTQKTIIEMEINKNFSSLPIEQQAKAKAYFDKLTLGEKVDLNNYKQFVDDAIRISTPIKTVSERYYATSSNSAPTFEKNSEMKRGEELSKQVGLPTMGFNK